MGVHQQFSLVYGERISIYKMQVIFVDTVASCQNYVEFTVLVQIVAQHLHACRVWRTSSVSLSSA